MRVWFQKHVIAGRLPVLDATYERHLAAVASPGTELHIATLPEDSYPGTLPADWVAYGQVEELFSSHFAAQAVVAERAGYDAFVIATSQDPGIVAARRLVSIPVLGYGETAFATCAWRRLRFGIIGFIPALQEILEENIRAYGHERWYVGSRYLPGARATVEASLTGDDGQFRAEFEACAAELAAEGAQVIIPGEGVPNELLNHLEMTHAGGIPVLDANGLVLRTAELLAGLERDDILPRTTVGYDRRKVEPEALDHFLRLFAPTSVRAALAL
jgi:allantoin racemase